MLVEEISKDRDYLVGIEVVTVEVEDGGQTGEGIFVSLCP